MKVFLLVAVRDTEFLWLQKTQYIYSMEKLLVQLYCIAVLYEGTVIDIQYSICIVVMYDTGYTMHVHAECIHPSMHKLYLFFEYVSGY